MLVCEWMTPNPVVISPDASFSDAFRLMQEKKIHRLPVVDQDGRLLGIITEKDIRSASQTPENFLNFDERNHFQRQTTVNRRMTRQVITTSADCPVEEAARIMLDHNISSLPVMVEQQLAGIITRADILQAMTEALGGRSAGLRLTVRLPEDQGEIGAITDGILKLGGSLVSISTFWGSDPYNRFLTCKFKDVDPDELILWMEEIIGVQVVGIRENAAESPIAVY